jgi:hypothetical protein
VVLPVLLLGEIPDVVTGKIYLLNKMEDSLYDAPIDLMNSQCGSLHNLVVDLMYRDYAMYIFSFLFFF